MSSPKKVPHILCIGIPVRDGTFRVEHVPERGFKETVKANPGYLTTIRAKYDLPTGVTAPQTYVYHCHILEHEDNDMMRPFTVTTCGQLEWLPQLSVAVQVTVVSPTQNCAGASLVMLSTPLQSSVAVAVPMFTATQHAPLIAIAVPATSGRPTRSAIRPAMTQPIAPAPMTTNDATSA